MPRKACKTGTSRIHKTGQKSTSIIKRWVLIFCEEFVNATSHAKWWKNALQVYLQGRLFLLFYRATALQRGKSFPSCAWHISQLHRDFQLLLHGGFLVWPHFYDKFLEKYIRLIFLPHFTTTAYGLYHSRYGFWQVHFRHLILHMRLLSNMIIDIHCDLCIWMFLMMWVVYRIFGDSLSPKSEWVGLIMELPPYHKPDFHNILYVTFQRTFDIFCRALRVMWTTHCLKPMGFLLHRPRNLLSPQALIWAVPALYISLCYLS